MDQPPWLRLLAGVFRTDSYINFLRKGTSFVLCRNHDQAPLVLFALTKIGRNTPTMAPSAANHWSSHSPAAANRSELSSRGRRDLICDARGCLGDASSPSTSHTRVKHGRRSPRPLVLYEELFMGQDTITAGATSPNSQQSAVYLRKIECSDTDRARCEGAWVRQETEDGQEGRATQNTTIIQADMIHILPSQMYSSNSWFKR